MTAPPVPTGEFRAVFVALQTNVDGIVDAVNTIIDGAGSVVDLLPDGPVPDSIRSGLADLRRVTVQTLTDVGELLAHSGDPDALRAVGAAWATDIGGPVSGLAGVSTLTMTRSDDHWTGSAADAYRNTLIPQNGALGAIKTVGDDIDVVLNQLANAIVTFWTELLGAIITLLVALAVAVAGAATVAGVAAVVGVAVIEIGAFATFVGQTLSTVAALTNSVAAQSAALERRLSDDTAFPRGAWPRSTTPISGDGSISDGDDTDWHLR